jgi:hypothetical protein
MISLKRLKLGQGGHKLFYLMALDGLAVALARRFIERGDFFTTIGDFATSWFIHFFAVGLFSAVAGAYVMTSRKFWLGGEAKIEWSREEALFAVLMTVLVAAIVSVIIASAASGGWYRSKTGVGFTVTQNRDITRASNTDWTGGS